MKQITVRKQPSRAVKLRRDVDLDRTVRSSETSRSVTEPESDSSTETLVVGDPGPHVSEEENSEEAA